METQRADTDRVSLTPEVQWVWSPRYVDATVPRDRNTDTDGLCDNERIYHLGDANFNVTALVDTGGDAVERYVYEPYGKETDYDGSWSGTRNASSYGNVVRYTGRVLDVEMGNYHYRLRYYESDVGQFATRDPLS